MCRLFIFNIFFVFFIPLESSNLNAVNACTSIIMLLCMFGLFSFSKDHNTLSPEACKSAWMCDFISTTGWFVSGLRQQTEGIAGKGPKTSPTQNSGV